MLGNPVSRACAPLHGCLFVWVRRHSLKLPSNATLKGSYYVRYLGEDTRNSGVMSFQGTMVFDGAGKFTLTGQGASSRATDKVLPR